MIRLGVRVLLLSGAAAALALFARDPLARRVVALVDRPARVLAVAAREIAPKPVAPAPAVAPAPFVLPRASGPVTEVIGAPSSKPAVVGPAKPKSTGPHAPRTITRKELEGAIANGLPGASAVSVKDEDGKPAGLRLAGVSRLAPFGVHDGDVLVSANGLPVRNADEALAALGALKDAHHVVVVFRRGAGAFSVPVDFVD